MLVRLFGRNFRSLRDDFELSMVAADLSCNEDRSRGVIEAPIRGIPEPLRLLRTVAIYGANASGKSTVLMAGHALRLLAAIPIDDLDVRNVRDTPFLFDEESRVQPITLGCDVVYNESILRYSVTFNTAEILSESLALVEGDGETTLIVRNATGEVGGELIATSAANKLYVKEMHPNVTVLAKLAMHGPQKGTEAARPYYLAIRNATGYADYSSAAAKWPELHGHYVEESFASQLNYREWTVRHLIQPADVGICGVDIQPEPANGTAGKHKDTQRAVVSFVHEGKARRPIDFFHESAGTKKLMRISQDWWTLSHHPIALFCDELSASLHPRLLDSLIRGFNEMPAGSAPSQLIFATHDTGLLESRDGLPPALRRDQVYITQKDATGATELYSLAEFKEEARPVHNIRKHYLSGVYGGLPSVDKLPL